MTHVLLLEPYDTGSHREWAVGYQRASRLDVTLLRMPGRFWKWRMHGAAATLSRRLAALPSQPDVVMASDMMDVAAFLGLARRRLANTPVALYMHENQLAYPAPKMEAEWSASRRRRAARRDEHYPFVNLTSMLASDVVLWNSDYNRTSFMDALPGFLRKFPDHRELSSVEMVAERSHVLPLGLNLRALDVPRDESRDLSRSSGPSVVLWNHRWEHDKDPERFFAAVRTVSDRGLDFRLAVLGESFGAAPEAFEQARSLLAPHIEHWGYVTDRDEYARLLWACDIVVSTARHEFFGAAVAEAIFCGCQPILPRALAYPELIPEQYHDDVLYEGFDGLVDRLVNAIETPVPDPSAGLATAMASFDWQHMAPRYDEVLLSLTDAQTTAN